MIARQEAIVRVETEVACVVAVAVVDGKVRDKIKERAGIAVRTVNVQSWYLGSIDARGLYRPSSVMTGAKSSDRIRKTKGAEKLGDRRYHCPRILRPSRFASS